MMSMFHYTLSLMLNSELHIVQLPKKLDRILDIGAGTGIWAIIWLSTSVIKLVSVQRAKLNE